MEHEATKINPYDWINPIYDPKLFAGRKEEISKISNEILRIKEETRITPIIVVIGERRVGKTSLLLRIEEKCREQQLISIKIPIEEMKTINNWEFWNEIFSVLLLKARSEGVVITGQTETPMGFTAETTKPESPQLSATKDLMFPRAYQFYLSGARVQLSTIIIQNDLEKIIKVAQELGYEGLILILDEAHILLDKQGIKQQLRNTIQSIAKCGVVFAGETTLAQMFTDPSEPFFGQGNVIPLDNFIETNDVSECALLPLADDEFRLMSPMTIQYIARLSRGKPNQIRLICSSIYKRYINRRQDDLNISIDVLDDILEDISHAYEDRNLKNKVSEIQRLNSVELEILYSMTRYPNWNIQNILDLDESFRGEGKSNRSISRRRRCLEDQQNKFIQLGLMIDDKERYQLAGGEFLSLYLRFFYETRKYGRLEKKLILGKGPPTPFGEKTEKLVKSLAYHFGQPIELQSLIFHHYHRDFGNILEEIRERFLVLEKLRADEKFKSEDPKELVLECLNLCELIGKEGSYYLLCLSVRNRDNPRQIIQVELYFDLEQNYVFDLESIFNLLNQQAEDARVLIEGYYGFWVYMPDLRSLLDACGLVFEDVLAKLPLVAKWQLSSIDYLVKEKDNADSKDDEFDDGKPKWVELYSKGEVKESEEYLIQQLTQTTERRKQSWLYNDLGYIRSGDKLKKYDLSRKDLETAFDLHYSNLPLTLLNLSYMDLIEEEYGKSIEKIEAALLLTLSPSQSSAAYLRLRLPENNIGFRLKYEQHPANIIEAAYINLAYATLKLEGYDKAFEVLQEGTELIPSSIRIKHAIARLYIYQKRVDLSTPIYAEISQSTIKDRYLEFELKYFQRHIKGRRKRKTKKKR